MGNTSKILSTQSFVFQAPVNESLNFLTKWNSSLIKILHQYYLKYLSPKLYLTSQELEQISCKTFIDLKSKILLEIFSSVKYKKVNFLELLSVIITYSQLSLEKKILLIFQVFDFDQSKSLSKNEVSIMSQCFFKGIQSAVRSKPNFPHPLKPSSSIPIVFEINSSESILQPDFLKWVKNQRSLVNLLFTNSLSPIDKNLISKTTSKTLDNRCQSRNERPQRNSDSSSSRSTSKGSSKKYTSIFNSVCNRLNKAQASLLYQKLMAEQCYTEGNRFYNIYHLKLKTELTLKDFLRIIKEIKNNSLSIGCQSRQIISNQRIRGGSFESFNSDISSDVLKKIFKKYDVNGDGLVDLKELKRGLKEMVSSTSIEEIFQTHDEDKNKGLDFNEFIKLFSPLQPKPQIFNKGHKKSSYY